MASAEEPLLSTLRAEQSAVEARIARNGEITKRICLRLDKEIAEADSEASRDALDRQKQDVIRKAELLDSQSRGRVEELREELVSLIHLGTFALCLKHSQSSTLTDHSGFLGRACRDDRSKSSVSK